ncbi:MAG: radical SAM protein [Promethearchaeota archaeon]
MSNVIARHLVQKCSRCGRDRFSLALDHYLGKSVPLCRSCQVTTLGLNILIRGLFRWLNISEDMSREILSHNSIRRGIHNVVRGIARLGLMRPQPTAVPTVIVWNFTNQCNLHCLHCHQDSTRNLQNPELTPDQVIVAIDRMAEAGVSVLTFSGGEPLLRSDLIFAIQHAYKQGIMCTVASNGILMTSEMVDRLGAAGVERVEIGLDGVDAKTHSVLRGSKDAFEKTVQGIKNCVKSGHFKEVSVTTTLNKANIQQLPSIIDFVESLGATRHYTNRIIPAGRGKSVPNLTVSKPEIKTTLRYLFERFKRSTLSGNGIQCYARGMTYYARVGYEQSGGEMFHVGEVLTGYDHYFREQFGDELAKVVRKLGASFGGCTAGITYCSLSPQGDIWPCTVADISLGNILEDDLETVWTENRLLNYMRRRQSLKGNCGQCRFNGICGGCRFSAYIDCGDWLGQDPSCPFGPAGLH